MKKFLALLLLSPLIFSQENIVDYCSEKYDSGKLPKEFAQCITDLRDAFGYKDLSKSKSQNQSTNNIHDKRDLLHPDALKQLSASQQKKARKIYAPYANSKNDKAFALSVNFTTFSIGDGYGYCEGRNGVSDAQNCARNTCAEYKKGNELCVTQYINDTYVLPERIAALRSVLSSNKKIFKQQSNQIDWGRAARAAADVFNNNPAFGRSATQPQDIKRTYFLKNNYMDGMNRVCVYDGWTETINGIGLCELTIRR